MLGVLVCISCEPIIPQHTTSEKLILYPDYNYEDVVGYARIVKVKNGESNPLENPVIILGQDEAILRLEFDLLNQQTEYLSAKIYHCNRNWKKSSLLDLDFFSGINFFNIQAPVSSINTLQPYLHYQFKIPAPTLSGNYLIAVFKRSNPQKILFTRRFVVVKNIAIIKSLMKASTTVSKRLEYQQLEISIDYGKLSVIEPFKDINIAVLQNHNWTTIKQDINPTLIRPNENYLEYRPIGLNLNFEGGNEYRFFDMQTLNIKGRNISQISNENDKLKVSVTVDKSRANEYYGMSFRDINGNFLTNNTEIGKNNLHSDYAWVHFVLQTPQVQGKVYLTGRFNFWKVEEKNRMIYDIKTNSYQGQVYLKQGYYEYAYYLDASSYSSSYFENSYAQTENVYEIFVYYTQLGTFYDQVVGYQQKKSGGL